MRKFKIEIEVEYEDGSYPENVMEVISRNVERAINHDMLSMPDWNSWDGPKRTKCNIIEILSREFWSTGG